MLYVCFTVQISGNKQLKCTHDCFTIIGLLIITVISRLVLLSGLHIFCSGYSIPYLHASNVSLILDVQLSPSTELVHLRSMETGSSSRILFIQHLCRYINPCKFPLVYITAEPGAQNSKNPRRINIRIMK